MVVVVIAILSSVTVVGYSGITNKADSSQTAALVQEWTTTLNMYKTMSGTYPKGNLDYKSSWTVSSDDAMLNDIKSQTGGRPVL